MLVLLDFFVEQVGICFLDTKLKSLLMILHKDVDSISFNCTPRVFSDKCAQPFQVNLTP